MATQVAVHNIIRSRFKTQVADAESVPVQYPNTEFTAPENSPWIKFMIQHDPTEQITFPAPTTVRYRTYGRILAQVFTPLEEGTKEALELARVIEVAFRRVTVSGVRFETPSVLPIGRREGVYQVNVECEWWHDDVAA